MIEGIELTPLKIIPNELGDVLHGMKASETTYRGFGEAYFSTVKKSVVKGWKKHLRMTLNLVVPTGSIRFVAYDDRDESNTCGQFFEVKLSKDNYYRLTSPPGIWLSFEGVGDGLNLLLNLASIEHDPTEVESCALDDITRCF